MLMVILKAYGLVGIKMETKKKKVIAKKELEWENRHGIVKTENIGFENKKRYKQMLEPILLFKGLFVLEM